MNVQTRQIIIAHNFVLTPKEATPVIVTMVTDSMELTTVKVTFHLPCIKNSKYVHGEGSIQQVSAFNL